MIEGLTNLMTSKAVGTQDSDGDLEKAALLGAEAIKRIIADRDDLQNRNTTQERELVTLSAINEDLRRRIAVIRQHYVELGTKILAQLEQFDEAFRDAIRGRQEKVDRPTEHANLVALARRLRPNTLRETSRKAGD